MTFRQALAILVLASGLGACATYYSDGVQYDDGSYYSPPDEGEGDYYFAPQPRYYHHNYHYDWYFGWPYYYGHGPYGSVYGSPFYRYDDYCPVAYRYCPAYGYHDSFPYFGLSIQFYDPWIYGRQYRDGDGYGHGDGYSLGYGYGYGRGYGHGHRRGDGDRDRRGPPRSRRPNPPAAPPAPSGENPSAGTPPEQDWTPPHQDEPSPRPRRVPLPRRDPRADLVVDAEPVEAGPVATVNTETSDATEKPVRRWRNPSQPTASAPTPRAQAPAPAPTPRSAPAPEPSSSSSDGDTEDSPRAWRRGGEADGRN